MPGGGGQRAEHRAGGFGDISASSAVPEKGRLGETDVMSEPRYWFPVKRYGWGWGLPRTWEGWAVLVVYGLVLFTPLAIGADKTVAWVTVVIVDSVALVGVCWWKGERPRWRWGGNRSR